MMLSLNILIRGKNIDVTILGRRRSKVIENQFHRWLNSIFLVWLSGLLNLKDSYLVFNILFTQSFEEFYKLIDEHLFCFSLHASSIKPRIRWIFFELLAWCTKVLGEIAFNTSNNNTDVKIIQTVTCYPFIKHNHLLPLKRCMPVN